MNINFVTVKGKRPENEDKHSIIMNLDNSNKEIATVNFLGVYDGHGGNFVSNFLSDILPNFFLDKRIKYPVCKNYIYQVYRYLQKNLKKNHMLETEHCGSTCLIGIHYKKNNSDYLNVINAGDSRCVLCRDNFAIALTKDHKPDWPEEKFRIEELGGKIYKEGNDCWRIKDLAVSRSFGDFDAEPFVTSMPEIFRYKLDANDKFIIFACDGLWDVMSNQDAVNFVLHNCYDFKNNMRTNKANDTTAAQNNVARKLANEALRLGSSDNLTIIVYFLD